VKREVAFYRWVKDTCPTCRVRGCSEPPELHHVKGVVSRKTSMDYRPRQGPAIIAVVPLCGEHHRDVHRMGVPAFERAYAWEGYLLGVACGLLAEYVMEGSPE